MLDKVDLKIQSGAKSIFSPSTAAGIRGALESGGSYLSEKEYDKVHNRISELASNPQSVANHLADGTKDLYAAAPNITQGLHNNFVSAVQFLNSKLPKTNSGMPLSSSELKPSQA